MKVRLESAKCDGFGTCAAHSPEIFELDEWGYASVKGDGEVTADLEGKVNRAVADCPVHAIIVS
ncbi:ferredoxin [Saccharopolyspora phatthalungensis]|uniref:Ferredoxin n=1 Tax=Saccharopolyspora phatthalungensis TaxID=664693 RepID=A0A840Q1U0_9PSEU|nr:ferredoxin [Saccharopolyspora phatthalungensis]MBB5156482.1 ferredoxin [Saccharopolyspora phatthalungensis]